MSESHKTENNNYTTTKEEIDAELNSVELVQSKEKEIDWENLPKVALRHQFYDQKEFAFVNVPFKNYDKEMGVRYALSENEISV